MKKLLILSFALAGFCWLPQYPLVAQSRFTMGWLRSPHVQKELEIVDEQMEQIEKLQSELQSDINDVYAEIRKLPREEQAKKYGEARAKVQELNDEAGKKLNKILLPQQIERLEQVSIQMRMRGGAANGLRGELAEKIGMTEEQQKQLREKAAEKNKELFKKYAELRAEMEAELLEEVLSPQQRKQLDDLIGEPVDFTQWQDAIGQGRPTKGGPN